MDHTSENVRKLFLEAHELWAKGDLNGLLERVHEDILYIVNVDGQQVPYAMSAVGREDLRDRLQLLLDTFDVTNFEFLGVLPEPQHITSQINGVYRHKKTSEVLDIRVRFRGEFEPSGLLTRIEELHDARYIEAFERFVFFLEQNTNTGL